MFREKTMPLEEWAAFQDNFDLVWGSVLGSDDKTALFIEAKDPGEPATILIPSYKKELFEALSPDGWEDCDDARDRRWTLLLGHASALEDFGLRGTRD